MSQLPYLKVTEKDKTRRRLLENVLWRRSEYFYYLKGRDRGREAIHLVLVDMNKKQQYLEQAATGGSVDAADYGIICGSEWGHEIPQSFKDRLEHFGTDLINKLVCVKLLKDGCEQVYYTLTGVARDNDFIIASSEEEVRRIGKILYSTRDEDPAESLCSTLEKVFFGLAEYTSRNFNELLDSIRKGELQRVTTYLEEGGDVNSVDEYGLSLLHYAAVSGNVDLVRYLKEKGANVHAEDKLNGRKPVHIAAKEGHPNVISYFLDNEVNVNECDQINWTPLHYAVWRGDLNTIRCLVERGACINAKDIFKGKAPIHIAAEHGYVHVMEYLIIEKDVNIETEDEDGRTPLYYSVMAEQYQMFKFLIRNNANTNVKNKNNGRTLLHASIFWNNKEIIEDLVKAGLEINGRAEGWTPLLLAATNYKLSSLTILADLGADLFAENDAGESALVLSKDHADMVLHLVFRMCKKLQEEEKYSEALELYTQNIDSIKTLRQDHPEYLEMKNYLGIMLYEMGHFDEAADILSSVHKNRELFFGSNHTTTLNTKHRLALVYEAQLNHMEAMTVLKQVLEARKTILGDDHEDTLNVAFDVADLCFKTGEYDKALEIFEYVFEKRNKNFGSDHHKTLQANQEIAVIYVNKGEFQKALHIFNDILEKRTNILGSTHRDTLSTSLHVKLTSEKIQKSLQGQGYIFQVIDWIKQILL